MSAKLSRKGPTANVAQPVKKMTGLANVVVDVVIDDIDDNGTIGRPVASVGKRLSVALAQPQPA